MRLHPFSLRLPADVHQALRKAAAEQERTRGRQALVLLRQGLRKLGYLEPTERGSSEGSDPP